MNKSERFKTLIEVGYFPEELPPPFHTTTLSRFRESVVQAWANKHGEYPKTTYEIFSNPRIGRVRRNLAIVNPIAQLHVCKLIADNWVEIRKHLRTSKYALEVPDIVGGQERAVPSPDFSLVSLQRLEISASFNHALVSDVSRFYGTLYTHAIPWALHGKKWCKKNLHNKKIYDAKLGARLDKAIRKCQDNQTIGIPTGSDTSRIISEIVAVAIDQFVQKELKIDNVRAFRHVDDWYIGFDNAGEAEDAIATLATACRDYELELNAEKTRILHASSSVGNSWPTELRQHRFLLSVSGQTRTFEHYFTKVFAFVQSYPKENVLDFAIKRTRGINILKENWRIYETFLLKTARANSTVIPSVVQILVSYNFNGYELGRKRILKLIEDVIKVNAPLAHHAKVAWALFLAKALKMRLSKTSTRAVCGLESSVCGLLALDLQGRDLVEGSLDTSLWQQSMNRPGLQSSMWLLAYEADFKGWLQGDARDFVDEDNYFGLLKAKGISFYDIKKNITHIKKHRPKRHSEAFYNIIKKLGMPKKSMPLISDASMSPY